MQLWSKLHKLYYIIYIILSGNSNGYLLHCSGFSWEASMKKRNVLGCATPCQRHNLKPVPETYIYHKNETGKTSEKQICPD